MVATQRRAMAAADAAVMNADEAGLITGVADPQAAAREVSNLGPRVVAVTAGASGAWLWNDGQVTFIPAYDVQVRYDIGAGDAFHAGLVVGLLRGLDPERAGRLAAAVAALKISRPPTLDHLPRWEEAATLAQI
jgi:sugar/nucleoside kinase (ribokinase family)